MGFRPVEMKRSDFFRSPSANETAGQVESSKPAEDQGPVADDQASPTAAREQEATADGVLAADAAALPPDTVSEGADVVIAGPETVAEATTLSLRMLKPPLRMLRPPRRAVPEGVDGVLEGADAVADSGDPVPGDAAQPLVAEDPSESASGADASVQAAPPQTSGLSSEAANKARHDRRLAPRPSQSVAPSREGTQTIERRSAGSCGRARS